MNTAQHVRIIVTKVVDEAVNRNHGILKFVGKEVDALCSNDLGCMFAYKSKDVWIVEYLEDGEYTIVKSNNSSSKSLMLQDIIGKDLKSVKIEYK
jgi:hypothetical protein